jgi:hypothetical protein
MTRLALSLFAALFGVTALSGCLVGPVNDRLYVSEWKSKREHPIKVYREWTYQGEPWEHTVVCDGDGDRP